MDVDVRESFGKDPLKAAAIARALRINLPRFRVAATCKECDYAEEMVCQAFDNDEWIRKQLEPTYRTHVHHVRLTVSKVTADTPLSDMRCLRCNRTHPPKHALPGIPKCGRP